jgi:hypothetical protein
MTTETTTESNVQAYALRLFGGVLLVLALALSGCDLGDPGSGDGDGGPSEDEAAVQVEAPRAWV